MNNKHIAVTIVSGTKTMTPVEYDTALNQLVDIIRHRASLLLGAGTDPDNLYFTARTVATAQTHQIPSDHISLKDLFDNPRDRKDLNADLHILVVHNPELNPRMNQPLRRMASQTYAGPRTSMQHGSAIQTHGQTRSTLKGNGEMNFDLIFGLWGPNDKDTKRAQPVLRDLAGVRWTQANPATLHAPTTR